MVVNEPVETCDNRDHMKIVFPLFFLCCICFVTSACRDKTSSDITKEEVEKIINEKILIGSSISDVKTFLNNLKIRSRTVDGMDYYSGRSEASFDEDRQPPNVDSYIAAVMRKAGHIRQGIFNRGYYITMHFFFDEDEKLIGFNVQTLPESF